MVLIPRTARLIQVGNADGTSVLDRLDAISELFQRRSMHGKQSLGRQESRFGESNGTLERREKGLYERTAWHRSPPPPYSCKLANPTFPGQAHKSTSRRPLNHDQPVLLVWGSMFFLRLGCPDTVGDQAEKAPQLPRQSPACGDKTHPLTRLSRVESGPSRRAIDTKVGGG